MGERRFYTVPQMGLKVRCHLCKRVLEPGDTYCMSDDDSWLFCEMCGSGKKEPQGPKQRLYAPHERTPLHKKQTLEEQCQM